MTVQLAEWMQDNYVIDWLYGWLAGSMVDQLSDWPGRWHSDCLSDYLNSWQNPLHGTAFLTMWRMHHLWRHLNPSSKPIFSSNRITAIKSLNSCTVPYPSTSAMLRHYKNRLIYYKYYYSLVAGWIMEWVFSWLTGCWLIEWDKFYLQVFKIVFELKVAYYRMQ